ncbi:hypothetical protein ACPXB1_12775 [Micromonospora sp. DT68]|uniref:hypothetical protein n=1 Tax=Micromonospora sp. DT68 TaxID=3416522 RepID=UPI003CE728E3
MDLDSLVRSLGRESTLAVESSEQVVTEVLRYAKEKAKDYEAYRYGKNPSPVRIGPPVRTSAAQVLHEVGVATTFLTASPLAQVARHWAHVRYCATLTVREGCLALSRHAGNVVYHHKVAQSEQLGIGLALVVAKAVLRQQYPDWDFHAVDAEVALKAGFIDGVGASRPGGTVWAPGCARSCWRGSPPSGSGRPGTCPQPTPFARQYVDLTRVGIAPSWLLSGVPCKVGRAINLRGSAQWN